MKAVRTVQPADKLSDNQIQPATTEIGDLANMFTSMILSGPAGEHKNSIEGLAYATLQPDVKEAVATNIELLKKIITQLSEAPPVSPVTYGALRVFANLTTYPPVVSEEQKKMAQLKSYALEAGKLPEPDPLESKAHVEARCKAVFEAGITPVLVTQSKSRSPASLSLIASIISSLSVTKSLCGPLAQQGAVKLLLFVWHTLTEKPSSTPAPRAVAAQALARILIRADPNLVFGGNRSTILDAVRPLTSLLVPHSPDGPRDFLPSFEALMALTNLASVSNEIRSAVSSCSWPALDDLLLSSIDEVSRASVELICNLVQDPSIVESHFAPSESGPASGAARNRLNILLAFSDANSLATRSAAGGALASLTSDERVVQAILEREGGVNAILGLCKDCNEDLKHRGVVIVLNMIGANGGVGRRAREIFVQVGPLETLKDVAKKAKRLPVLEVINDVLEILLGT